MTASTYLKILSTVGFRRLVKSFAFVAFGLLWLLLEPVALFFPGNLELGWLGYFGLVLRSLAGAIVLRLPPKGISQALSSPDSSVGIKVGRPVQTNPGVFIIRTNDVFDTRDWM